MKNKTVISKSVKETFRLAEEVVHELRGREVLALHGDLGSGKTTFVQGLAKALGIEKRIISATFVIMRTYRIMNQELGIRNLYHIDLYRTETERDIEELGIQEFLNDKNSVVAIEWAEKLGNLIPEKRIDIRFEYIDEQSRKIQIF